jgi:hypothetical protein
MREQLNHELYRIDRIRRDRARRANWIEAQKLGLFALAWALVFAIAGEVLRVFWHADAVRDALPLCWFFIVLGCCFGRAGLRREQMKERLL